MGIRLHLAEMKEKKSSYPNQGGKNRSAGDPVHLWRLTEMGHQRFP